VTSDTQPRLTALVPMRHHSERVPGKNYRLLAGKPLYAYILETLAGCPQIERIVVDTDSPTILEGVRSAFPEVVLLDRPEVLRGGMVAMNDVLLHDAGQVVSEFYLQTHTTNPFLRVATVEAAISRFFDSYPEHDSLFSVSRWQTRLYSADGSPLNHDPRILLRTQDLAPVFEENSCIYIFPRALLLQTRRRIGQRPELFEIDRMESMDIDEEWDFSLAEALLERKPREGRPGESGLPAPRA
jgi:CMP-N-acetylneuraminic acid synthetase